MGFLEGVRFGAVARKSSVKKATPAERRKIMLEKIDQQIEAVKAEMNGKTYTIKNKAGKEVDVRKWFWSDAGHVNSNLIYGNNILNLGKNSQIIAGSYKQLIT